MRKKPSRIERRRTGIVSRRAPRASRLRASDSRRPFLIAITGGSGAGKTFLASQLAAALGVPATRISLDDFYRDRPRLSLARRERINFDHPRAIEWPAVEKALRRLARGDAAPIPQYDFKTHSRVKGGRVVRPEQVVLIDGLWLLRRPALRRLFALKIFIRCPADTRLQRRLARDLRSRGRTRSSVQHQFSVCVQPMHERFVAPQERRADIVLDGDFTSRDIGQLAARVKNFLTADGRPSTTMKGKQGIGRPQKKLPENHTNAPRFHKRDYTLPIIVVHRRPSAVNNGFGLNHETPN
jgi:uridine kinase